MASSEELQVVRGQHVVGCTRKGIKNKNKRVTIECSIEISVSCFIWQGYGLAVELCALITIYSTRHLTAYFQRLSNEFYIITL